MKPDYSAILFFSGLSLLIGLGGWQLSRGFEKHALKQAWDTRKQRVMQIKSAAEIRPLAYQEVILHGEWQPARWFLLDNRVHQNQIGFEVLSVFRLHSGDNLLVNRGWVGAHDPRLPRLGERLVRGPTQIAGVLYRPEKGFTLGPTYTDQAAWPRVIQYFDPAALATALAAPLSPSMLVLNPDTDAALVPRWRPGTISAARHYGYTLQWWGLAAVLCVFGCIWRRQKTDPKA